MKVHLAAPFTYGHGVGFSTGGNAWGDAGVNAGPSHPTLLGEKHAKPIPEGVGGRQEAVRGESVSCSRVGDGPHRSAPLQLSPKIISPAAVILLGRVT